MSSATGETVVKQVLKGAACLFQWLITDLHIKLKTLLFDEAFPPCRLTLKGLFLENRVNPTLHPHSCLSWDGNPSLPAPVCR